MDVPSCSHGNWTLIHALQILFLAALFLIPLVDLYSEKKEAHPDAVFFVGKSELDAIQPLVDTAPPSEYGSVQGSVDDVPVDTTEVIVATEAKSVAAAKPAPAKTISKSNATTPKAKASQQKSKPKTIKELDESGGDEILI